MNWMFTSRFRKVKDGFSLRPGLKAQLFMRVSMGLTDSRKTAKNLADSRKTWKILTVSRK